MRACGPIRGRVDVYNQFINASKKLEGKSVCGAAAEQNEEEKRL